MPDAILLSARDIFRRSFEDLRAGIEGLPADALNWKPAGEGSNSIAALTTHSMLSTRIWLALAVDAPLPDRDRDAEFEATAASADGLLTFADKLYDECLALISEDRTVDWGAFRKHWDPAVTVDIPAAWALIHPLEHIREHVGHIGLTRQLWEARSPADA